MQMRRSGSNFLHKNISQFEILSSLSRSSVTRERILKQLEQLEIDVNKYADLPLKDLAISVEEIMRNTYSIKYLGLNKNEMGIISRRINPLADQQFKVQDAPATEAFSIHKYFYPKPLKTAKKGHLSEKISVDNLETEIKKEFEENRSHLKENRLERPRTKVLGSWCSLPKAKTAGDGAGREGKEGRPSINELAKLIEPKADPSKSYSRFLNQGILIIRD